MPLIRSTRGGNVAPLYRSSNASSRSSSPASSFRSDSTSASARYHARRRASLARYISFASAVLCALCAGSVTTFSLYGHIFQQRLHYSQYQVNGVAIASSIACYLPVPFLGYVADRSGPAPLALVSSFLFGGGYGLAAGLYRRCAEESATSTGRNGPGSWSYVFMIISFVAIGCGTSALYLSAVSTCAKNFGRGKHRGLALAVPIAAFGLSGMWESQIGSRLLYERLPDGQKGDVNVFYYFFFLAILLFVVGLIGTLTLRIVDEAEMIDEAVQELERSGLLEGSALLTPGRNPRGYGATERPDPFDRGELHAGRIGPDEDEGDEETAEDARLKKRYVLNAETRRFLSDHTAWLFALGFFFMIGPGEAFINNLGTVIGTLYPPHLQYEGTPTSAATHVSIVAVTSTIVRLLSGSLTDLLAPSPQTQHVQVTASTPMSQRLRFSVSRVVFLLFFALLLSAGLVTLASGAIQDHGDRFWIVSVLVGFGYGAVFSLTPIIITVIWGVENFGTNWGLIAMFPAAGATMWGLIYSAVYQAGVSASASLEGSEGDDSLCYGTQCYASTFWAMAASVWFALILVVLAWKGKNGWSQRGIVI